MRAKILEDVVKAVITAGKLPSFSDEAAVATYVGTVATALVPVVYDLVKDDQQALLATITPEEVEAAYNKYVAECPCDDKQKLTLPGGQILDFLKNINWTQVIAIIMAIINAIPKS